MSHRRTHRRRKTSTRRCYGGVQPAFDPIKALEARERSQQRIAAYEVKKAQNLREQAAMNQRLRNHPPAGFMQYQNLKNRVAMERGIQKQSKQLESLVRRGGVQPNATRRAASNRTMHHASVQASRNRIAAHEAQKQKNLQNQRRINAAQLHVNPSGQLAFRNLNQRIAMEQGFVNQGRFMNELAR